MKNFKKFKWFYLLIVILFVLSLLVLFKNSALQSFDERVSLFLFNKLSSINLIVFLSQLISDFTILSIYLVTIVGIIHFIKKKYFETFILLIFSGFTLFVQEFSKFIFERSRPFNTISGIQNLSVTSLGNQFSFPSGHSTMAFFIAFFVIFRLKKSEFIFKVILVILACLVAFSRMVLGVHYLSDIIAGAILGILIARFSLFCENLLKNSFYFKKL